MGDGGGWVGLRRAGEEGGLEKILSNSQIWRAKKNKVEEGNERGKWEGR